MEGGWRITPRGKVTVSGLEQEEESMKEPETELDEA